MAQKQLVCCARRTSKLTHDRNSLRVLAQRAAYHSSKGRDITKLRKMIEDTKALIERDKQVIVEHEAEHAAGTAPSDQAVA